MRTTWLSLLIGAALFGVFWWAPPAAAQDAARLVIVDPPQGSTVSPDVRVVVRLVGGTGEVPFSLLLDGGPTPVQGSQGSDTPVVSPGEDAIILLPDMDEGSHQLQAVPLSSSQAQASRAVSFTARSGGLSFPALLIAAALIGLLILYRRRILAPWADRYDRGPPPGESEKEEP